MELSDGQKHVLMELINVGFGRAPSAFSKLTRHGVILRAPNIAVYPVSGVSSALREFLEDEVATVHQIFSGPIGGDALLILDRHDAAALKRLLTDEPELPIASDPTARDVLTEVGNVLLNACLGAIANMLHVDVSFSVPALTLDTLGVLLDSLMVGREGLRYALVINTGFQLRGVEVKGYLVVVLTVASLGRLFRTIEDSWLGA